MKKIGLVALAFCLVVVFSGSVSAADVPGQKLTPDELASVTGKADPITIGTLTVGTQTSYIMGTPTSTGYVIAPQQLSAQGVYSAFIFGRISR